MERWLVGVVDWFDDVFISKTHEMMLAERKQRKSKSSKGVLSV